MKKTLTVFLCLVMTASLCLCAYAGEKLPGYVCVTDYLTPGTGEDLSAAIQGIIDANPNRTIYFPDGEYLVSAPVLTPADPSKSVDLQLSNYAVIKAAKDFEGGAVVILGGKDAFNNVTTNGSNYSLTGGIIDGSGFADGIEIASGRETRITLTSIKHTAVGIVIDYGANSGSSDSDITDVNIIGNDRADSVGIVLNGFDNCISNVRIGHTAKGMVINSAGNSFKNIHPLFCSADELYHDSVGFTDNCGNNVYDYCYSDQFMTGFVLKGGIRSIFNDCYCYWWKALDEEKGFVTDGKFNSVVTNMRIDFRDSTDNTVLEGRTSGTGVFENLSVDTGRLNTNLTYRFFLKESPVYTIRALFMRFEVFFDFFAALFRK